jgi:hypothetical protein
MRGIHQRPKHTLTGIAGNNFRQASARNISRPFSVNLNPKPPQLPILSYFGSLVGSEDFGFEESLNQWLVWLKLLTVN